MIKFLKKCTPETIFLSLLLIVAAFLRLYNLSNSLMFLGDQGRDALLVADIFRKKDLVFIGPVTSVGNMYLGPFYYYFMLPFLLLSYPNPIGPVVGVALLSLLTIYLLFQISKKLFGKRVAWYSVIFYSFSVATVTYARFSWNPNIAPFFSLLMFFFSYLAWQKNSKFWIPVALCFGLLIQLHYVALLSLGGAGIVLLLQLKELWQKNHRKIFQHGKTLFRHLLLAVVTFLLTLLPLFLFDIKHDFLNSRAFLTIFTNSDSFNLEKKAQPGWNALEKFFFLDLKDTSSQVLFEPSFGVNTLNHPFLFVSLALILIYFWQLFRQKKQLTPAEQCFAAYLFTGILGISLYQNNVYLHYIAYLFPFIYLFYGMLFAKLPKKLSLPFFLIFLSFFLFQSFPKYPLKSQDWTITDMQKVAESIQERVKVDDQYNLVLLSDTKDLYAMNYRYFLSTMAKPALAIEASNQANLLFIINEEKIETDVANLPIYEIVIFPNHVISEQYQIAKGPEISVLRAE